MEIPAAARVVEGPRDWPRLLAAGPLAGLRPDFLSGEYENRGRIRTMPPFVLAPAVLLLLLSAIFCLSRGLDYSRVRRAERQLAAETESIYRRAFPGESVIDPRRQMEKKLALSSASGGEFLPVLAEIAPELVRADGFRLRRLRYDGRVLVLEMDLAGFAEFDRVRTAVAARLGRTVRTGQIRKKGTGARGELRIDIRRQKPEDKSR